MSNRQSEILEASAKGFDAEGLAKGVVMRADPLADARAWLAAMEASMRRTAQQAQQSSNVITLRSAKPYDVPPGNQFLGDGGQIRTG